MRFTATHAKTPTPRLETDRRNPFELAACADADPEIFFPGDPRYNANIDEPLAICATCPIRQTCLDATMRAEEGRQRHGIFGGTTPQQRTNLARAATRPSRSTRKAA